MSDREMKFKQLLKSYGYRGVPIYKRISVEELKFWLTDLLSLLKRIYTYYKWRVERLSTFIFDVRFGGY